jgi:hypothetical protein
VGEELEQRARDGVKLKLHKTVEGRSFRAFRDKNKAVERLIALGLDRDDIVTEEVASPARAEELLIAEGYKKKDIPELLDGLIFKPPGKATLASIKDSRPALATKYDDAFSEFSE